MDNYKNEIDIRDLFQFIIKSGKLIVATTLILGLSAGFYSHFIKTKPIPNYESSVKIVIGNFEDQIIQDLDNLSDDLEFYFDNIKVKQKGYNLLELKTNSSNPQDNINLLEEIIEFAILDSVRRIESKISSEIKDLQAKLDSLNNILTMAPSVDEIDPIESPALSIYLFKTTEARNEIKYLLKNRQQSKTEIKSYFTKQYGAVDTRQTRNLNNSYKEVILASILGFFLSIFVILFRFIFTKLEQD